MNFLMVFILTLCTTSYAAEETINNGMQGILSYQETLHGAQIRLVDADENRDIFLDHFKKGRYVAAGGYLQYLTFEEQNKYKNILLQKALEKKDLDLLGLLDDLDIHLLTVDHKQLLEEAVDAKRKKASRDQGDHYILEEFDIARALTSTNDLPEAEQREAYAKMIKTIAAFNRDNKLKAVTYIAEFGPVALLISFCIDTSIDMIEVLNHLCRIGRVEAACAILASTKDLLKVSKHEGAGEIWLKSQRHKRLQPLFTAYRHGHYAIAEFLVQAYPCLLLYSCDDDLSHTIFYDAMLREDYDFIKKLIRFYPLQDRSQKDYSVLQVATAHGNHTLVRKIVTEDFLPLGVDFFKLGCTENPSPWILAVLNEDLEMLKFFIEILVTRRKENRKFTVVNSDIAKAVGAAVFKKNKKIIELLHCTFPKIVSEGLSEALDIPGHFDRTIIEFALENNFVCFDKEGAHFIIAALKQGYLDILDKLIEKKYPFEKVKSRDEENLLQAAVFTGNAYLVTLLAPFFSIDRTFWMDSNKFHKYFAEHIQDKIFAVVMALLEAADTQNAKPIFYCKILKFILHAQYLDDNHVHQIIEKIVAKHPSIFTIPFSKNLFSQLEHDNVLIYDLCLHRTTVAQLFENQIIPAIKKFPVIHRACSEGSLEAVQWLLKIEPGFIDASDDQQSTLLHSACKSMHKDGREIIQCLCAIDPKLIKKQDIHGNTALHALVIEVGSRKKQLYTTSEINSFIEKVELLLHYDENILSTRSMVASSPIRYYAGAASFSPNVLHAALDLYKSKNVTIEKDDIVFDYALNNLSNFLNYLEISGHAILPFAELDALFAVTRFYQTHTPALTILGLQYGISEFLEGTHACRTKSCKDDVIFLFEDVPVELGITPIRGKKTITTEQLQLKFKELKTIILDNLYRNPEGETSNKIWKWLNARRAKKSISRIAWLFSDAQIMAFMIQQMQDKRDIITLLPHIMPHFNLKRLIDGNGNTLLYHAIKHNRCRTALFLSLLRPRLLKQHNKDCIASLDLLPEHPYILQHIMGIMPLQNIQQ